MASAERAFIHATIVDPTYMPAYLHLGQYYLLNGEKDLAYQYILMVIESEHTEPNIKTIAERMLDR